MMKLRNRSYVKYSTYALIAAFMVSMTPAGAMADVTVGSSTLTGDVVVTGILDASGATVTLGTTTADSLTIGGTDIGATVDTNTGAIAINTAEIVKIGDVLGTDYKNPEFDSLTATGDTTLGGALTANAGATVTGGLLTANDGAAVAGGLLTANDGAAVTGGLTADTLTADTANVTVDLSVGVAGNNTVIKNGTVTATGLGKFGSLEANRAEFSGLKVNGATELNGALGVNGNVHATGNISAVNGTFSGDVSAKDGTFTGTMTAQDAVINNNLNVGNDATIDGTLSAGADNVVADSNGLTVGNKVTVGAPGSLTTIEDGDITTNGTLTADGGALINNGLEVNGDAAFNDNASIGNQLTIGKDAYGNPLTTIENGDITTAGNVDIGGTLDVTGNTTLGGTLNVAGDAAVEGTFYVAGTTTLDGKLTANDGALINNGLEVNGDAAFNNNATIEENLTVKGESSLEGKVTIGTDNQTIIDGDTVDTGTVNTGTVNTDFANVDEKLTVGTAEGNQTFVKGSKITSEAGVQGTTVIDGGKLTVSKPVTTRTPGDDKTEIDGGNITATGKGTFGSLQVNGNANIGGDATVDGKLYAKEGGVFSNSASDFSARNNTVINGDGMEISENGTIAAYYGKYGMQVGRLTYDGMRNTLNVGGGTITGLADGGVYRGSSDAVTGNQLWQAYQRMDDLQESINIVGAHAAALSGLAPVPYNPYQPTTLSAAIGTYRDEYAVAVGVYHYVRDNVMFNLGASICSDGDLMGRAGISFAVGKKDKDKPALAKNMNDVQKQLMEVQYALQELKDENAALKKQLRKQ